MFLIGAFAFWLGIDRARKRVPLPSSTLQSEVRGSPQHCNLKYEGLLTCCVFTVAGHALAGAAVGLAIRHLLATPASRGPQQVIYALLAI